MDGWQSCVENVTSNNQPTIDYTLHSSGVCICLLTLFNTSMLFYNLPWCFDQVTNEGTNMIQPETNENVEDVSVPLQHNPPEELHIVTNEQATKDGGGKYCKWTEAAVVCLVEAKLVELARLMNKADTKFHLSKAQIKWEAISNYLKGEGHSYKWTRCRDKWSHEQTAYKKISDLQNMSGKQDYFAMSSVERKEAGLLPECTVEHYNIMGRAMKERANINPHGVGDSGQRRKKKIMLPLTPSTEDQEVYTSQNDVNETETDEYSTGYPKKKKCKIMFLDQRKLKTWG
jgi:Myb/SANT-like DNA-binding domain